jgi:Thermolysin metallopeptidase, catalytic domain
MPQTRMVLTGPTATSSSYCSSYGCGALRSQRSCRCTRRRHCFPLMFLGLVALVHHVSVTAAQESESIRTRASQQESLWTSSSQQLGDDKKEQQSRNLKDVTIPNLETFSCENQPIDYLSSSSFAALELYMETMCVRQTKSSTKISTGDLVLDNAHNYLLDVHAFYLKTFQRNSVDGKGRRLRSYVHFGVDYNDWELNYFDNTNTSTDSSLSSSLPPSSSLSDSLSLTVSSFRGDRLIYGDGDGMLAGVVGP